DRAGVVRQMAHVAEGTAPHRVPANAHLGTYGSFARAAACSRQRGRRVAAATIGVVATNLAGDAAATRRHANADAALLVGRAQATAAIVAARAQKARTAAGTVARAARRAAARAQAGAVIHV